MPCAEKLIKTGYQKIFLPATASWCEGAHETAVDFLSYLNKHPNLSNFLGKPFRVRDEQRVTAIKAGIFFQEDIFGLPSGFDKNATMINALSKIYGAGHIEIGTIIYNPHEGNPKTPTRLKRYSSDRAAGNNFGLPSLGAKEIMNNYVRGKIINGGSYDIPVGAAIAVNPGIKAYEDKQENITKTLETVIPHRLSWLTYSACPNVSHEGDRESNIAEYKKMVQYFAESARLTAKLLNIKLAPLALKISPDLSKNEIKEIVQIAQSAGYEIIIATNSSRTVRGYEDNGYSISGAPLFEKSLESVKTVRETSDKMVIIACGGIDSPEKWAKMVDAGADLCQTYTGVIYNPFLFKELKIRQNTV